MKKIIRFIYYLLLFINILFFLENIFLRHLRAGFFKSCSYFNELDSSLLREGRIDIVKDCD
jgi:hypothetical protein